MMMLSTWSAICFNVPHSQVTVGCILHLCMVEEMLPGVPGNTHVHWQANNLVDAICKINENTTMGTKKKNFRYFKTSK